MQITHTNATIKLTMQLMLLKYLTQKSSLQMLCIQAIPCSNTTEWNMVVDNWKKYRWIIEWNMVINSWMKCGYLAKERWCSLDQKKRQAFWIKDISLPSSQFSQTTSHLRCLNFEGGQQRIWFSYKSELHLPYFPFPWMIQLTQGPW